MSLSGVSTTTWSTWSAQRWAAVARASSHSNSIIDHTRTPIAFIPSSASGNWSSSTGSMPALDLYAGYTSLRNDSITVSNAAPRWVTSGWFSNASVEAMIP